MDENESNWLGNLTLDDMFVKDVEKLNKTTSIVYRSTKMKCCNNT